MTNNFNDKDKNINNEGHFGGTAGYRNPPKRTQFKKGESGNPKGKKNKTIKTLDELIQQALESKVALNTPEGAKVLKTKREVIAHQIVNRAAKGDVKMINIIAKVGSSMPEYEYSEDDKNLVEDILKQFNFDKNEG